MFQYEYSKQDSHKVTYYDDNEIHEYFLIKCDFDGFSIDSKYLCKEIPDYSSNYTVQINPFEEYNFSVAVRNSDYIWSDVVIKQFTFAPNVTILTDGELQLGKSLKLICNIDLDPSVVDSISWTNQQSLSKRNPVLRINPLTMEHHNQNFTCQIKYGSNFGFERSLIKNFQLKFNGIEDLKFKIKLNTMVNQTSLMVSFNIMALMNVTEINPEKLIFKYSVDNDKYDFVAKYYPFISTSYDYTKGFRNKIINANVNDIDACATLCLQTDGCNHYVFRQTSRRKILSDIEYNCDLTNNYSDEFRYIGCQIFSKCFNLIPYKQLTKDKEILSLNILPNLNYTFQIQVKDKTFNWSDTVFSETIYIPLEHNIEQIGEPVLAKNETNYFELYCKTNMPSNFGTIEWMKYGETIEQQSSRYKIYTKPEKYLHSYLKFIYDDHSLNLDGMYSCKIKTTSNDLKQTKIYLSDVLPLEFKYKTEYKYEIVKENLTVPMMPGILFALHCSVDGYPYPSLQWRINKMPIQNRSSSSNNSNKLSDIFTIAKSFTENSTATTKNVLLIPLNEVRASNLYECILNDSITLKQYYLSVIDNSPILDVKVDTLQIDKLKITFDMNLTSAKNIESLNELEHKPLKYRITYKYYNSDTTSSNETNGLTYDIQNYQENNTSNEYMKVIVLVGVIRSVNTLKSCKIACIYNPFCELYKYIYTTKQCLLFTYNASKTNFEILMEKFVDSLSASKKHVNGIAFTDDHLNIDSDVENELDTLHKVNHPCETELNITPSGNIFCTGYVQTDGYINPFTFSKLLPDTTYVFKIEAMNPFGRAYFQTKPIYVPFPEVKIKEIGEKHHNSESYSLLCEVFIDDPHNFFFRWLNNNEDLAFRNEYKISVSKTNQTIVTELKFNDPKSNKSDMYVCSVNYQTEDYLTTKNVTFFSHYKYGPLYKISPSVLESIEIGSNWNDTCTAEGWPLPNLQWVFNNNTLDPNKSDEYRLSNYHHHSRVFSHLYIQNFSKSSEGTYVCKIDGVVELKSLKLKITNNNNKAESSAIKNLKTLKHSIIITILCIFFIGTLATAIYIYWRKRSNNFTSHLRYSQMEEEILTGMESQSEGLDK